MTFHPTTTAVLRTNFWEARGIVEGTGLEADRSGFESHVCYLPALHIWQADISELHFLTGN